MEKERILGPVQTGTLQIEPFRSKKWIDEISDTKSGTICKRSVPLPSEQPICSLQKLERRWNRTLTFQCELGLNFMKTLSEHLEAVGDTVAEKDLVIIYIFPIDEEKLTWDCMRDRLLHEYERCKGEVPRKSEVIFPRRKCHESWT